MIQEVMEGHWGFRLKPLVLGSSPGGPTRNENTNLRVGIFLSAERMTK